MTIKLDLEYCSDQCVQSIQEVYRLCNGNIYCYGNIHIMYIALCVGMNQGLGDRRYSFLLLSSRVPLNQAVNFLNAYYTTGEKIAGYSYVRSDCKHPRCIELAAI